MKFELPKLSYSYTDLEPHLDAATMEIHYTKHHQTYCDKFNAVIEKYPELNDMSAEEIIKNVTTINIDEADRTAIINMGGGYLNHNFYWNILGPTKQIDENLVTEITQSFGSIEEFKKQFTDLATKHFASGWTWLVRDNDGQLKIYSLPNQASPLSLGHTPLITIDLWEHAYYLKYQNRRADFIAAWWNVLKLI